MTTEEEILLAEYEIVKELSAGTNAVKSSVFLVEKRDEGKVYLRKDIPSKDNLKQLRLIKDLNMSGVPKLHHIFEEELGIIVIEEYINYSTLTNCAEQIKALGANSWRAIGTIMIRLCEIVEGFHRQVPPMIHRDIKPDNILVDMEGLYQGKMDSIYLIDFGAVKSLSEQKDRDTKLIGTVDFAAPEQFGFAQSDERTDVYGIGATLKYILEKSDISNVYMNALEAVGIKATRMAPQDRYSSASELKNALQGILQGIMPDMENGNSYANSNHENTINISSTKKRNEILPPGFRSGNPLNMFIAVACYAVIIFLTATLEVENPLSHGELVIERIIAFIILMGHVVFFTNYMGIQDRLPMVKSRNWFIKLIGCVIYVVCWWVALIMIMMLLQALFRVLFL